MKVPYIEINGRRIGLGSPTYIIAEVSANHGHDYQRAVKILEAAKDAGADAVKLQTYTADTLTINCSNEHFRISGTLWEGRTLYDLYKEAYTPWQWQPRLKAVADDLGLDFFSTPFDPSAVDFLDQLGVAAYKIASFEVVDLQLLGKIGGMGKPVIMSTGMATIEEISEAVQTLRRSGQGDLALLKCTSSYPAPVDHANLATVPHLASAFSVPTGISDHTMGLAVPLAAVTLGASIIEKHLTLSRSTSGPDSAFSLEPHELKNMVAEVRRAEKAVGDVFYGVTPAEEKSRVFRRSLFAVEDVKAGDPFTGNNVRSIRPGYGLHTRYLPLILSRTASRDIPRGTPLSWDLVGGVGNG